MTGFDPAAPTPDWLARRIQLAGMRPISLAVDVTNYVMLELGQPIHGYDAAKLQGPIGVRRATRRRAAHHPRRRRPRAARPEDLLITDDSGPIGLGGRHGRRDHRDVGDHHRRADRGRALGPGLDVPHRPPPQAALRGRQALRARRRPDDLRRPRPTGSPSCSTTYGGGTVEPGRHRRRRRRPRRRRSRSRSTCRRGSPASTIDDDTTVAQPRGGRLRGRRRRRPTLDRDRAAVAARPHRPLRPGRGGRPDRRLRRTCRRCCPTAPAGRGLTRAQRLRRRVGRTLAGAGFVEVVSFPFVGERRPRRARAPGRRRRAGRCCGSPTRSPREEPSMTTTLLPGLLDAVARNVGRGATDLALFEIGTCRCPHAGQGTDPAASTGARPTTSSTTCSRRLPDQPLHLGIVLVRRSAARVGLVGRRSRRPSWADAIEPASARSPTALGVPIEVRSGSRAPWHPGRCAEVLRRRRGRRATPASCTRGSARPAASRRAPSPPRSTSTGCCELAPDDTVAPAALALPGRQGGRRAGRRRRGHRGRGRGGAPRAAPASCSSRCGCSTSTPAARSARARSRWPSRCASARPTGPSPRPRPRPPATRRWRWPPSGAAPCSAAEP